MTVRPDPASLRRRLTRGGRAAGVVAAAGALFAAGVMTGSATSGSASSRTGGPQPSATPTVAAPSPSATGLDALRDKIEASAAGRVDPDELDQAAVQGMLGALHDKYAGYLSAAQYEQFEQNLNGRFSGVGLWLRDDAGGLEVASVQVGSPAAEAGVKPGDALVSVAGKSAASLSVASAAALLRGEAGTSVRFVVKHGRSARALTLVRRALPSDDVTVDKLTARVGRITIGAFTRGVGLQVREGVAQLRAQHVTGIVLDLRDNPGGLLDEAVEAASALLPAGSPVVSYAGKGGTPTVLKASGAEPDTVTPVAVLVDGATASAAEILAGALQDDERAVIVGSRTFGKGTVQQPMPLADGSAIELTIASYRLPSGRTLDGVGLDPDIAVPASAGDKAAETQAIEVLGGLLADAGTGGHG